VDIYAESEETDTETSYLVICEKCYARQGFTVHVNGQNLLKVEFKKTINSPIDSFVQCARSSCNLHWHRTCAFVDNGHPKSGDGHEKIPICPKCIIFDQVKKAGVTHFDRQALNKLQPKGSLKSADDLPMTPLGQFLTAHVRAKAAEELPKEKRHRCGRLTVCEISRQVGEELKIPDLIKKFFDGYKGKYKYNRSIIILFQELYGVETVGLVMCVKQFLPDCDAPYKGVAYLEFLDSVHHLHGPVTGFKKTITVEMYIGIADYLSQAGYKWLLYWACAPAPFISYLLPRKDLRLTGRTPDEIEAAWKILYPEDIPSLDDTKDADSGEDIEDEGGAGSGEEEEKDADNQEDAEDEEDSCDVEFSRCQEAMQEQLLQFYSSGNEELLKRGIAAGIQDFYEAFDLSKPEEAPIMPGGAVQQRLWSILKDHLKLEEEFEGMDLEDVDHDDVDLEKYDSQIADAREVVLSELVHGLETDFKRALAVLQLRSASSEQTIRCTPETDYDLAIRHCETNKNATADSNEPIRISLTLKDPQDFIEYFRSRKFDFSTRIHAVHASMNMFADLLRDIYCSQCEEKTNPVEAVVVKKGDGKRLILCPKSSCRLVLNGRTVTLCE
jgi:hypothetical protein